MVEINWTSIAISDLQGVYDYIAEDSITYAGRFVDKLIARVEILETHPESGRIVPEFDNPSLKELIEGSYRIIYRIVNEEKVEIIRIHHSARLLK
ncbi:type II toxin-antitoxin system RelE/ParE family toxin [Mucilaginibacter conchicola]|uniref:Type II toxin-antitoxin system RelE/ParE family toxin n=1 Tax=Mucilaginibacter conchicola TaxID=2303333 RepID=A0A372NNH0_9SPHI|nr:type II toxin-antitoxin system RelE/ParE family toxin [Mucilaginibacter conchicola]RFZ90157.1 type II toxin-antitoxin system RelE/ParE family toxin [Mucilaginibacter conchicola]